MCRTCRQPRRSRTRDKRVCVILHDGWDCGTSTDLGDGVHGGGPVTSSRITILSFTIHKTNIYVFTSFKIRGRIKVKNFTLVPFFQYITIHGHQKWSITASRKYPCPPSCMGYNTTLRKVLPSFCCVFRSFFLK